MLSSKIGGYFSFWIHTRHGRDLALSISLSCTSMPWVLCWARFSQYPRHVLHTASFLKSDVEMGTPRAACHENDSICDSIMQYGSLTETSSRWLAVNASLLLSVCPVSRVRVSVRFVPCAVCFICLALILLECNSMSLCAYFDCTSV